MKKINIVLLIILLMISQLVKADDKSIIYSCIAKEKITQLVDGKEQTLNEVHEEVYEFKDNQLIINNKPFTKFICEVTKTKILCGDGGSFDKSDESLLNINRVSGSFTSWYKPHKPIKLVSMYSEGNCKKSQ